MLKIIKIYLAVAAIATAALLATEFLPHSNAMADGGDASASNGR